MNIPRLPIECTRCHAQLQGELDTFGEQGEEICAECWYAEIDADDSIGWYGMAPHHHDFTATGSWIGSTVFDALPAPDEHGVIALPDGQFFVPDMEVGGVQGTYYRRHPTTGATE
jgi:hypothetical protein